MRHDEFRRPRREASILGARTRSRRGTATRVQINQLRGQLKQLKRATRRARSWFSNVT